MNAYIWSRAPERDRLGIVAWKHAGQYFTIPARMLVSIPKVLTDAQVADLRAAYLRDRARLNSRKG